MVLPSPPGEPGKWAGEQRDSFFLSLAPPPPFPRASDIILAEFEAIKCSPQAINGAETMSKTPNVGGTEDKGGGESWCFLPAYWLASLLPFLTTTVHLQGLWERRRWRQQKK